ncbi:hypothetical protein BB560_001067 [Smittium megazygosporum]|uniref:Uncharacterized protein n=1 Tax=Smittium megazygosporum TaxID=133381 RepID=A0A2T9ZIL5_9FUNG|nr:hypothetical protein BB560_001067 [Smittium megazygosporum]
MSKSKIIIFESSLNIGDTGCSFYWDRVSETLLNLTKSSSTDKTWLSTSSIHKDFENLALKSKYNISDRNDLLEGFKKVEAVSIIAEYLPEAVNAALYNSLNINEIKAQLESNSSNVEDLNRLTMSSYFQYSKNSESNIEKKVSN